MSSWTSCRVQDAAVPAYTSKSLNKGDLKLCYYYMPIILNMLGDVKLYFRQEKTILTAFLRMCFPVHDLRA